MTRATNREQPLAKTNNSAERATDARVISELSFAPGEVRLEAAAGDSGLRKFEVTAYSGGIMRPGGYPLPVVVDIRGVKVTEKGRPALVDHQGELSASVGHTTAVRLGDSIVAEGVFSGANAATTETLSKLDNGFPLQASVGMRIPPGSMKVIKSGQTVRVNGRDFAGPILVATRSELKEISFVPLGADDDTSVRLSAGAYPTEDTDLTFDAWLAASGWDAATLTETQLATLRASYGAQNAASPAAAPQTPAATPPPANTGPVDLTAGFTVGTDGSSADGSIESYRRAAADESARCDAIRTLCARYGNPKVTVGEGDAAVEQSLEAAAIRDGWDATRTELEAMRVSRPAAPAIHIAGGEAPTQEVLTAAVAMAVSRGDTEFLEASFDDQTLERASRSRFRNIGPQQLMQECLLANGVSVHPGLRDDELIRVYQENLLHASSGFTTLSLPGILGSTAQKFSWESYRAAAVTWNRFCSVASHSNFHTHTHFRLNAALEFEEVGKDGELKNGEFDEESYTNRLKTYGGRIQLNRQDIINDDLGKFRQLPRDIGRKAARAIEAAAYSTLIGNAGAFFSASNGNLVTGSALSYEGLSKAEQAFLDQVDANGDPIDLEPAVLLVSTANKALAERYMRSTRLNEDTTTPEGEENIHAGKFDVVTARPKYFPQPTDWYLIANSADEAPVEVAFLNGRQGPTIEQEPASFEVLGTQWRYWMDFGVAQKAPEAAVKCIVAS